MLFKHVDDKGNLTLSCRPIYPEPVNEAEAEAEGKAKAEEKAKAEVKAKGNK